MGTLTNTIHDRNRPQANCQEWLDSGESIRAAISRAIMSGPNNAIMGLSQSDIDRVCHEVANMGLRVAQQYKSLVFIQEVIYLDKPAPEGA